MKLKEIYNEFNNKIVVSNELGILIDFELFFDKTQQEDVTFVFEDNEFYQLMKALTELDILPKDIIVNSYNLLDTEDKFYSESILIRTTKEISEIKSVFTKYRMVEPYSIERYCEDEEYRNQKVIWWFKVNGEVVDFKSNMNFVDNMVCLYFE